MRKTIETAFLGAIVKGRTTRAEVIRLLGTPSASYIPPMVKETSGKAIGYTYAVTRDRMFFGPSSFRKLLRITFDGRVAFLGVTGKREVPLAVEQDSFCIDGTEVESDGAHGGGYTVGVSRSETTTRFSSRPGTVSLQPVVRLAGRERQRRQTSTRHATAMFTACCTLRTASFPAHSGPCRPWSGPGRSGSPA